MFAKIIQKWNIIKSDWDEYKKLRHAAGCAWRKLEGLRKKITHLYFADDTAPQSRCIRSKLLEVPKNIAQDSVFDSRGVTLYEVRHYCPHFKEEKDTGKVTPCAEKNCPYYMANCEYAAAVEEYEAAQNNRRAFWRRDKSNRK